MDHAQLKSSLVDLLSQNPQGLHDFQLTEHFGEAVFKQLPPVLNELSQQNRITFNKMEKGVLFKLVDEQIAQKLAGLNVEVMMVYEEIKSSGNSGIWNRDIKTHTNVQQQTLTKALKELERRMLIKSVKSIHQKTKKIWMLYDLSPSSAITGGPWYTDNEFDHEFVNEIARLVENQIKEAWLEHSKPTSMQQVDDQVKKSGVSQEPLSTAHIKQILNRLIFDQRIEPMLIPPEQRHIFKGSGPWYRSSPTQVTHYDHFTAIPCGVCPVSAHCAPGGVISPEKCVYLDEWFKEGVEEEF